MATLYEIRADIERLTRDMIDPETGEINEDILEELHELDIDHKKKIENILLVAKNKASDAEQHEKEAKIQKDKADRLNREAERLRQYVALDLKGEKFETDKVEVRWRRSKSVEITDEDLVPDEFKSFETKVKISKTLIKKAIDKENLEVPGAVLVENLNMRVM